MASLPWIGTVPSAPLGTPSRRCWSQDGQVHLSWAHAVIRGQAGACNFTASFLESKAGRIYKPYDIATQVGHAFASGFRKQIAWAAWMCEAMDEFVTPVMVDDGLAHDHAEAGHTIA